MDDPQDQRATSPVELSRERGLRMLAEKDARSVAALLRRFPEITVAVAGDVIYDAYLDGRVTRLSREGPVPVVGISDQTDAAGGGANVAVNLAALGAKVTFCSVIGDDQPGRRILEILERQGVAVGGVVASSRRQTCAKRRVLADGRMLLRFDEGTERPPARAEQARMRAAIGAAVARSDAVLLSDYGTGVVTDELVESVVRARADRPLVVAGRDPRRFREARGLVCASFSEISPLLAPPATEKHRAAAVAASADVILAETGADAAVVTLDSDGAVVIERGRPPRQVFADVVPERCSAGAGDTFAAALTLATVAGADITTAAEIASVAAAVVVGKSGTATCGLAELRLELLAVGKVIPDVDVLRALAERHRRDGRRIIMANGCFDILHRGHAELLDAARRLGDVLIVALNGDASVRRLKGPSRPVNTLADRVKVLAALSCVDHIIAFDEDEPTAVIRALRPDVLVKGGDYTEDEVPEAGLVRALGGSVQIFDLVPEHSTTRIIERVRLSVAG
jgi:rfaE bifunctional protein kinase chain/domain/rfaE bifunctional protein nucleotidyltransferase chain/domain